MQLVHSSLCMNQNLMLLCRHLQLMEDILSSKAATFFAKDSTLMHRIAAIHVAYHSCESQILWCVQLMHRFPEITDALANMCRTSSGGLVCNCCYYT